MIQARQIGRARVARVLEYSAPTHDPAFLFPDLAQSDLDAMADKLTPHHYVPAMNRLVITIQMWIVQIDDKVIVIDTGVGNDKPRTAPRMKNLNIRVGEWLEAAGAGLRKGHACGANASARRPHRLEHGTERRQVGPHLPKRAVSDAEEGL